MNIHEVLDNFTVSLSALFLGTNKFFSNSINSTNFRDNLQNITLKIPEIQGEGYYEVTADTLVGKLDPAFHIDQWYGKEFPTIIYHHGNNERPFDYSRFSKNTFKNILHSEKENIKANLIVLRAPFHSNLKENIEKMQYISNFVAMLSVSVRLIEQLVLQIKKNKGNRILVSGISLGGWITNLHRTYYNSADIYIPIFAGAALGDIFINSVYHKMTGKLVEEHYENVRKILNFEMDYIKVRDKNVYPLLAYYDQIIQYERQKKCYEECQVQVIEKGHITGAMSKKLIREHILQYC